MAGKTTALVGKLQISGKEAKAELDAVKKKIDDLSRSSQKPIGLKLKMDSPGQNYLKSDAEIVKGRQDAVAANSRLMNSNGQLSRSFGDVHRSGHNAGMGVLELSRAFEDAQYGMRGVLNNIPGIIQSFGGSAGLAGIVSAAAVSFSIFGDSIVRAWNELADIPQWAKDQMAHSQIAYGKRLAGMQVDARQNAEGAANLAMEVIEAEDRRRAKEEALVKDKKDILQEERLYAERVQNNKGQTEKAKANLAALKAEQQALERKQKTSSLSGPETLRLNEAMPHLIAEAQTHASARDRWSESDAESLRSTRAKIAEEKHGKSMKDISEDVSIFWSKVTDGIKEVAEQAKKRRTEINAAAHSLENTWDAIVNRFRDMGTRIEERRKAQAQARETASTDLAVSEIRNPGARKKAARAVAFGRRTRQLMDEQGLDAATAADVARREQRVSDRNSGDRTIHGAGEARQYQGLDSYKQFRDGNLPTQTDAQKRGRQALEEAKKDLKRTGIKEAADAGGKSNAENILNQILTAIKEQKGPADRNQPIRK